MQPPAEENTQSEMAEQELRERSEQGGERQMAEELGAKVEERPLFLPTASTVEVFPCHFPRHLFSAPHLSQGRPRDIPSRPS